jgi:hypothetical protein
MHFETQAVQLQQPNHIISLATSSLLAVRLLPQREQTQTRDGLLRTYSLTMRSIKILLTIAKPYTTG